IPTIFYFFTATATSAISTLSLHDALPISGIDRGEDLLLSLEPVLLVIGQNFIRVLDDGAVARVEPLRPERARAIERGKIRPEIRSEEHTSELQSRFDLVCRLLLEKKKKKR